MPVPTIGVVVQRLRARGIDFQVWDLGGDQRFREDWKQHVRGCGALLFVVDCANATRLGEARQALLRLLEDPMVSGIPLLVLANKVDLLPLAERAYEEGSGWHSLIEQLNLGLESTDAFRWSVLGISATRSINVDKLVRWLVLQAHGAGRVTTGATDDFHTLRPCAFTWRSMSALAGALRERSMLAEASISLLSNLGG